MFSKLDLILIVIDAIIILGLSFMTVKVILIKLLKQKREIYLNLLVLIEVSYLSLLVINVWLKSNKEFYKCRIMWRIIHFLLINILGILAKWNITSVVIYALAGLTILLDIVNSLKTCLTKKKKRNLKDLENKLEEGSEGISLKEIQ